METNKKKSKDDHRVRRQESRCINMVRAVFTVCRRQHVPLYSSRYSRKDFTLWQHIALAALMQRIRKSYRKYVNDYLTTTEKLLDALGISKLPHFTTIDKFMLRVPSMLLERVMGGWVRPANKDKISGLLARLLRLLPFLLITCLPTTP